jgi:hypothetical protein
MRASWLMNPKKRMCVVCRAAAKKRRLAQRKTLFCAKFYNCLISPPDYDAAGIWHGYGKNQMNWLQ